jgi:hypothetical protein
MRLWKGAVMQIRVGPIIIALLFKYIGKLNNAYFLTRFWASGSSDSVTLLVSLNLKGTVFQDF